MNSEPVFHFFVPGNAQPGGSKSAFYNKRLGRAMVVDACKKNPAWKKTVAHYGQRANPSGKLLTGALKVQMVFHIQRPKSHFRTGAYASQLRPDAPIWHLVKPDTTKFVRAAEDALTGVLWVDDARIPKQVNDKEWCEPGRIAGVWITVWVLDGKED